MTDTSTPATKADIDVLRGELGAARGELSGEMDAVKAEVGAVRGELDSLRTEVRNHYATKADLAQMESRLIKWMVGLMVGAIAVASTLTLVVERLLAG